MQGKTDLSQTPAPNRDRGLLFLGLYGGLLGIAFGVLSRGMWVFFAPGDLKLVWAALILVLTLAVAIPNWRAPRVATGLIILAAFVFMVVIAIVSLQGFENSADEYAYVFQAKTYLAGRLWNEPPVLGQALASDYTWVKGDKWVGQYPPGWPALLALGSLGGLPLWAVTPLAGLGMILCLRALAKDSPAILMLGALSPFVLFIGASLHSHMAAAVLALLAVMCLEKAQRLVRYEWAVAAGLAVGCVGLIRYDSAVLVALPFALSLLLQRRWGLCAAVAAGVAPWLVVLLWYHWRITGNPLTPVYWLGGRHVDHLYFDWAGFSEGARISFWRWVELVEWGGPAIVPVWLWAMATKIRTRSLGPVDWVFPLFVLTFLFYPFDGANRYGPRYYFEAYPFMLLALRGVDIPSMIKRLCGLNLVYGVIALPFLAVFYHQIVEQRLDLYDQVERLGLSNAVVLVEDGPGKIWKMEPDDMARNGLTADGPVLYARADKTDERALHAAFPTREIWVYHCAGDECRLALSP